MPWNGVDLGNGWDFKRTFISPARSPLLTASLLNILMKKKGGILNS